MARKNSATQPTNCEESLVRRAQKGDRDAMEQLVARHRTAVRSHALRMLRDAEDANDATQETFVKAFRALGSFDAERPLLPWLMRICSNCCVDAIRERRRPTECLEKHEYSLCDDSIDVEADVAGLQDSQQIMQAIKRLPNQYREIIYMRHYRHMDVMEIADALHKPEGTVKSWLFRARALLRKDLQVAMGY